MCTHAIIITAVSGILDRPRQCAIAHDDSRIHLRIPAARCARGLLEVCPPAIRGRRECRAPAGTRGLVCNMRKQNAHEHTGTAGAARHSLRSGLTAYTWRRIPFASIAAGLTAGRTRLDSNSLRQLDTSHGCQNHTSIFWHLVKHAETKKTLQNKHL